MQKNKHDRNLQPAINKSRTETLKNPGQSCFYSPVLLAMLMKILLPCRHSAPDMPLRFIGVKHLACLLGKGGIDLEEPFGDIFMFGRYNLERSHFLRLIQTHLSQDLQASVNKYLHFHPYLLLSSESIALTADWSSGVHQ